MKGIWVIALWAVFGLATGSEGQETFRVEARGFASIFNEDVARARDEALVDARVRALESLGVQLDQTAFVARGRLMDLQIVSKTEGFLIDENITYAGPDAALKGVFRVEGEFWLKLDLTPEEARKYRRKFSVVLDIEQVVLNEGDAFGQQMPSRGVEQKVRDALIRAGFEVYNREHLARIRDIDQALGQVRERSAGSVQTVSRYALAEIVVSGRVSVAFSGKGPKIEDTYGLGPTQRFTYRAYPNVFAMEGETGREVAGISIEERDERLRGDALNPSDAARAASARAADRVAKEMVEGLLRYAGSPEREIAVVISGLPDAGAFQLYKSYLSKLRWVQGVTASDFQVGGLATYRVMFREDAYFLLIQLHRLPGLAQVEGASFRMTAVYEGH